MGDESFPPLFEKIRRQNYLHRAFGSILLLLLVALLVYRLTSLFLNSHGFPWILAFLCESCFTFNWILSINTKWSPVDFITYPEILEKRFPELPPVDMFVTTADPVLEPPVITVNTVLSLLAVDYPAHKLACYVSDDGCSPHTFYSLIEASRFAQLWVPFCKKYRIPVRAPFRYFLQGEPISSSAGSEFQQDWKKMKDEYRQLCRKIEKAAQKPIPCDLTGEFAAFSNTERKNHPTIIKIIWENKDLSSDGVPHLVYISREKRPKHPHHYKAGAMNVLGRVSGLMTNAPVMLNVDCDMFVNDPQVIRRAMCLLLGSKNEKDCGFVQFPQCFYDGPKDDPYGNQLVALFENVGRGLAGLQGYFYSGTGCFHRRKVIYGLCPEDTEHEGRILRKVAETDLLKEYGNSEEFIKSAADALEGKTNFQKNLSKSLEAANQVAGCAYEYGTSWGSKFGWIYGSTTEDILTGMIIHKKGWRSPLSIPETPAFLGCAPSGGPVAMTQQKRWSIGLLEILVSKNCPIFGTLTAKLEFRECLAYMWLLSWNWLSIPELCYAALPAYCIFTNSHFFPKVGEQGILIPVAIFFIHNLYSLVEYLQVGLSIRAWWNNMRMSRIIAINAWLFGVIGVVLKLLGISETVFEVTQKDQTPAEGEADSTDITRFTFDKSPIFIPGTTLLLVHLTALATLVLGVHPRGGEGLGPLEVFCSLWVVLCFVPFLKGLFRRGKYGIPSATIFKSAALALVFVHLCRT